MCRVEEQKKCVSITSRASNKHFNHAMHFARQIIFHPTDSILRMKAKQVCSRFVALHLVDVHLQCKWIFPLRLTMNILSLSTLSSAGNVFVIAAILLEKNLQSVANYLILSLAVADLLVACLVMPLSAVYEISREWKLGPELCDMWTSSDVLCCTASILHLVAIALDRWGFDESLMFHSSRIVSEKNMRIT